eukprot:11549477-Karenia_brevis.AAC.1
MQMEKGAAKTASTAFWQWRPKHNIIGMLSSSRKSTKLMQMTKICLLAGIGFVGNAMVLGAMPWPS